jgi:hypothetical protein
VTEPNSSVDPGDLDLLREDGVPSPAVLSRVRTKLATIVPMGGVANPNEGPDASTERLRTGATASLATNTKIAVAFLMGGIAGVSLYASLAKRPSAQLVYVDRPVVLPAPSAPSAESSIAPQTSPVAASVGLRIPSSKSRASQLSEERAILDEARAAMSEGNAQGSLDRLDRHRRLFPKALLAEERDALQVQALVKAARYDEARARANTFRKRVPGSLFLPMVDAAIDSIP